MRVVPVPCLQDNYAYLVICEQSGDAAVVDPSEAEPVRTAAEREGVRLRAIWNTHHHWDHVGGNRALADALGDLEVIAHASDRERVPGQTRGVDEGDEVGVGEIVARVVHNPGHTSGAISYVIQDPPAVFTGDTLFGAGCGRVFEGTFAQMRASLEKLASLPAAAEVYFGHEYTEKNLRFAAAAEPESSAVAERLEAVRARRARGEPSAPSTLAEELETNPFLRASEPALARTTGVSGGDPDDVFAALRRWKDGF